MGGITKAEKKQKRLKKQRELSSKFNNEIMDELLKVSEAYKEYDQCQTLAGPVSILAALEGRANAKSTT